MKLATEFPCGCIVEHSEVDGSFGVYSRWYMSRLCIEARDWYEASSREGRDWMIAHLNHPPTFDSDGPGVFDIEFDFDAYFRSMYKAGFDSALCREKAFWDAFLGGANTYSFATSTTSTATPPITIESLLETKKELDELKLNARAKAMEFRLRTENGADCVLPCEQWPIGGIAIDMNSSDGLILAERLKRYLAGK